MSNVIDSRVVEMKFDNSDFERNVKTSMDTIDNLKKSLDFEESSKGLDKLQQASNGFNMDSMSSAIQSISDRFSVMGIVGMTIIQDLTQSAINAAKRMASSISSLVIQGGISRAMNIEQAKFQIEGLGIAWEDVAGAINRAVDGTAYGLDAAALAASTLAASGVDYVSVSEHVINAATGEKEALTDMAVALTAISGVAAMTNSDYSSIADIFSTVAGQGKLMTMQLNQLAGRGLNAAAAIGKVLGKTEAEVRDMVTKGKIDFDTFAEAMFTSFAEHATEANETLTGVTSNIRSAFARIGADYISPIVQNSGDLVNMLKQVRLQVVNLKSVTKPFATALAELTNRVFQFIGSASEAAGNNTLKNMFADGLERATVVVGILTKNFDIIEKIFFNLRTAIQSVSTPIKKAFEEMFPDNFYATVHDNIVGTLNAIKDFTAGLKLSSEEGSQVNRIFRGVFALVDIGKQAFVAIIEPIKVFAEYLGFTNGFLLEDAATLGDWIVALDEAIKENGYFVKASEKMCEVARVLGDAISWLAEIFSKSYSEGGGGFAGVIEVLADTAEMAVTTILKFITAIAGLDTSSLIDFFSNLIHNIADAISNIGTTIIDGPSGLKTIFQTIKDTFDGLNIDTSGFDNFISNLVSEVNPLDKATTVISGIFTAFGKVANGAVTIITGVAKALKPAFDAVINTIKEFFDGGSLAKSVENTTLAAILYNFRRLLSTFKITLEKIDLTKIVTNIQGIFSNLRSCLFEFSQAIKAETLKSIATALLELAAAMFIISTIDSDKLAASLGVVMSLLAELASVLKFISGGNLNLIGAASLRAAATNLTSMATAILILSAALKVIASIDSDKLFQSFMVISALLLELTMISQLLSTEKGLFGTKATAFMEGATGLIAMAAAILILSAAVKSLSEIKDPNALWNAVGAISVLAVEMTVIGKLFSGKEATSFMSGATGLIAVAAALKVLAWAAQDFASLADEGTLWPAVGAMSALLAMLTIFTKVTASYATVTNGLSKASEVTNMAAIGFGMIEIAAAMKIFAWAAQDFAKLDWGQLAKAGSALVVFLGAVTLFAKLNGATTSFASFFGSNGVMAQMKKSVSLAGLGFGLIEIAVALKIFASAVEDIGKLKWEQLGKAAAAITVFFVAVGLLSSMSTAIVVLGAGLLLVSSSCLVLAAGLAVLGPALLVLTQIPPSKIMQLGGALMVFFAALGVGGIILAVLAVPLLIAAAAIAVFALAAASLAKSLSLLALGAAEVAGIGVLLENAFVSLIESTCEAIKTTIPLIADTFLDLLIQVFTSLNEKIPQILDLIFDLLIKVINGLASRLPELVTAAINLFTSFLSALSEAVNSTISVDGLIEITKSIGMLAAIFTELTLVGVLALTATIGAAAILGAVWVLSKIFNALASMDLDDSLSILDNLSNVMLKFGATMAMLALFGVGAAIGALAGMSTCVISLVGVLSALGGLKQIPGFEWLINEGAVILEQLGTILGTFIGNLAGGFMVGATSGLPGVAKNLAEFATNIKPFVDGMKKVDSSILESVTSLAGAIAVMTAADLVKGIGDFLSGGNSIKDFGKSLAEFAPYLKQYSDSIDGITPETVEASARAASALATFAKNIPNEGGLLSKITGDNSLKEFAKELMMFAPSMVAYSMSISGLKSDVVEESANAIKAIVEVTKLVPNQGGIVSWFTGDNKLSDFAEELVKFGPSLKEYADSVTGLKSDVVTNSVNAVKSILSFTDNIPNQGGIVSWFTGDNTLSKFGSELVKFGPKFAEYSASVAGVQPGVVVATSNAAKTLATLANEIPNSGGLAAIFSGENSLEDFGKNLVKFGESFNRYYATIATIDSGKITAVVESVGELIKMAKDVASVNSTALTTFSSSLETMAKNGISKFVTAFNNSNQEVANAVTTMLNYVNTSIGNKQPEVVNKMQGFVTAIINAIKQNYREGYEAAKGLVSNIVDGLSGFEKEFDKAGVNLVQGFINGMESKLKDVQKMGDKIGETAASALEKNLDEHSPSKRGEEDGENLDKGVIIGIENGLIGVGKAGEKIAEAAVKGIENVVPEAIKKVSSSMAYGGQQAESFYKKYSNVFAAMGKDTNESCELSKQAILNLGEYLFDLKVKTEETGDSTTKTAEKTKKSLENIKSAFTEFRNDLKSTIEGQIDLFSEFDKKTDLSADQLLANMQSQITGMTEWKNQIDMLSYMGIDQGLLKELEEMGPKGYQYTNAFIQMTADQLKQANALYAQSLTLPDSIADDLVNSLAMTGMNINKGLANGMLDNKTISTTAGTQLGKETTDSIADGAGCHSPSVLTFDTGKNICLGLKNGIEAYVGSVKNTVQVMCSSIINVTKAKLSVGTFSQIGRQVTDGLQMGLSSGMGAVQSQAHEVGACIATGIQNGIASNQSSAIRAAVTLATSALAAAKNTLGIASPSKEFAKLGMYIDEGLARGINDYSRIATDATEDMALNSIATMRSIISRISESINNNIDDEPVIRPVLDLSNINSGLSTIDGLFENNRALGLVGDINARMNYSSDVKSGPINVTSDNTDVINAITGLKSEISEMSKSVSKMKMVLNTGTLVGEIIGDVDQSLGTRAAMAGRGI